MKENNIITEIKERILELSDITIQRKLWLNENNDMNKISSYDELMSSLFDDLEINTFVESIQDKETVKDNLEKLVTLLDTYESKQCDKEIIEDPNWIIIVEQAKRIVDIW